MSITLTPDATRFLVADVTYLGEAPVGEVVLLPHGALLGQSGMPLLIPETLPRPEFDPEE